MGRPTTLALSSRRKTWQPCKCVLQPVKRDVNRHKPIFGSLRRTATRKGSQLRLHGLNITTGRDGQQKSITGDNHSGDRALAGDVMQEGATKKEETDCDNEALQT